MSQDWSDQLAQGLDTLRQPLDGDRQQLLLDYLRLLGEWNRAYNLTAVREPDKWVSRHLLDSLSLLPWLSMGPLLDVGSGAGLPGVPLAIARPDLAVTLLDSNRKRTRFLHQVVGELGLRHVAVVHARAEHWDPDVRFAAITSRAFASLADMVKVTRHLIDDGGTWLAMKGSVDDSELLALPDGIRREIVPLTIPGESASRQLVILHH